MKFLILNQDFPQKVLTSVADVSRHLLIETVGGVDEVINHGGLLLVERLHGSAAALVLNPLQNQTHDVDAEPTQ